MTDAAETVAVVAWGTERFGQMAIRAILDDPRLRLAGVYTASADEAGRDAGALCGRAPCGIAATEARAAIVALAPDTVIYTSPHAELADVVALLDAGADVVSTNPFHNLGGLRGETGAALAAACARGGSSLHITGLLPGWVDAVAGATTAICRRIDSIAIRESAYAVHYESPETWHAVGMGLTETTPALIEGARHFFAPFRDTVARLAELLGFTLDDVVFSIEHATTPEAIDLGWFRMERGTHAAIRAGWEGKANGRTVVETKMEWYLAKTVVEGWEFGDDVYRIVVEGEPRLDTRIAIDTPSYWSNAEKATPTIMPAVNAVLAVRAAPPGILGIAGAGLPHAAAGLFRVEEASRG